MMNNSKYKQAWPFYSNMLFAKWVNRTDNYNPIIVTTLGPIRIGGRRKGQEIKVRGWSRPKVS